MIMFVVDSLEEMTLIMFALGYCSHSSDMQINSCDLII